MKATTISGTRSTARRADPAPEVRLLARLGAGLMVAAFVTTILLASPLASAQEWKDLDEGQQALLAPWSERWDDLPDAEKAELLDNAERWATMTPGQRDAVRRRLEDWQAMTPEQRQQARERAERLRAPAARPATEVKLMSR